jgi:hypothetical protein
MTDRYTKMCATCGVEYCKEKSGVHVVEMASFGVYKIWLADLHKCPKCGHVLIAGFGGNALAEHYDEPRFSKLYRKLLEHGNFYTLKEHIND